MPRSSLREQRDGSTVIRTKVPALIRRRQAYGGQAAQGYGYDRGNVLFFAVDTTQGMRDLRIRLHAPFAEKSLKSARAMCPKPTAIAPTPPPAWRRRCQGMTMAEVMIAAVILGFVIMSSLTALSQAYGFTRHARMTTLAGQIVQSVMEDLRLRNFNELKAYAAQSQPVSFSSTLESERFSSNFTQGFSLAGEFSTLVASAPPQLGKISVMLTVTWTEQGTVFHRHLATYFSEKGLSDYYYVGWAP